MNKSKTYIIAFLAFCVLSSKNIIIYNEETLVALSFFTFVFFIFFYYRNTITLSLSERGDVIYHDLRNPLLDKFQYLLFLLKEYQLSSISGTKLLSDFNLRFYGGKHFFATRIFCPTKMSINFLTLIAYTNIFIQQTKQILKTVNLSKLIIQQKLQEFMAVDLFFLIHLFSKKQKKKITIG